ncbi:sec14p-like phosphatidylinositol transfer family protein [Tanacetum coccineum]
MGICYVQLILGTRTSNLVRHLHKGFLPAFGRVIVCSNAAAEAARFRYTVVDRQEGFLVLAIAYLGDEVTELTSPPELVDMEECKSPIAQKVVIEYEDGSNTEAMQTPTSKIKSWASVKEERESPSVTKKFERHLSTCVKVMEMIGLKLLHLNQIKLLTVISSVDDVNYPGRTTLLYCPNHIVVNSLLQERTRKKVQVLSSCGKYGLLKVHHQLYKYIIDKALGIKPRALIKQDGVEKNGNEHQKRLHRSWN